MKISDAQYLMDKYNNLSDRQKIRFDILYYRQKENIIKSDESTKNDVYNKLIDNGFDPIYLRMIMNIDNDKKL